MGKTTTSVNLGAALASKGKKVLLVDIDPQANMSLHLDMDVFGSDLSIYDLLVGRCSLDKVIRETRVPGLFMAPSNIDLCSAELELVNTVGRELLLKDALKSHLEAMDDPFDYVLIDCPPSLGLLSLNALAAAEDVFVPIQAEFFALQGMGKLMEVVNLIATRINAALKVTGIVICMYRAQTNLAKEVLGEVKSFFGDIVFESKIRQNIKLAEAPSHGQTIFDYDPCSNGALDYMQLAEEVLVQNNGVLREVPFPPSQGAEVAESVETDTPALPEGESAATGEPAPSEEEPAVFDPAVEGAKEPAGGDLASVPIPEDVGPVGGDSCSPPPVDERT